MKVQNKSAAHVQRVRAIWRHVRQSRGMSNVEFARELSQRLGFQIQDSSISRWIEGTGDDRLGEVPSADKFLAVLEMGGFDFPGGEPTGGDQALRQRVADLERQMAKLPGVVQAMASTDPQEAKKARTLTLPRAAGPGFLTATEAAARKGVARKTIYDWIDEGRVPGYRGRGGTKMVRLEELDAVGKRRPGPR